MKKKLIHLAALLCGMFMLWGCPQPTPDPVEPDVLVPISTSYTIGAEGGSITISFETNATYTVNTEATWLSVVTKATKATKVESVTVMAQANPSTEPRSANVIVKAGDLTANITVKQEGVAPSIEVTPSTGTVGPDGGSFEVTRRATVPVPSPSAMAA